MDYSPWFHLSESEKDFEKRIPSERASQEEQNGANFSFIAPSSEELLAFEPFQSTAVTTFTMHAHLKYSYPKLLTGRCYGAEIYIILLLLRFLFHFLPKSNFSISGQKPWTIVYCVVESFDGVSP